MANIITSKTRAKIMSQPKEKQKFMKDRRAKSFDKHHVETVTPINDATEVEIHEDMDRQGSSVKEAMDARREANEIKKKEKRKAQADQRKKVAKERIEKLEARDRKKGILQKAEKTRQQKGK